MPRTFWSDEEILILQKYFKPGQNIEERNRITELVKQELKIRSTSSIRNKARLLGLVQTHCWLQWSVEELNFLRHLVGSDTPENITKELNEWRIKRNLKPRAWVSIRKKIKRLGLDFRYQDDRFLNQARLMEFLKLSSPTFDRLVKFYRIPYKQQQKFSEKTFDSNDWKIIITEHPEILESCRVDIRWLVTLLTTDWLLL